MIVMRNSWLALLTIILNLSIFIDGLTQELSASSAALQSPSLVVGSMRRTSADKSTPVNSKVSRLRLLLLSELNHNSIPEQKIDSCWATSQTIKINAKCFCNQINCNAPMTEMKRRLISSSCLQVCCGNRYKKASIRSLSAAQLKEFRNFTLESSCEKQSNSNSYIIAKINDKLTDKTICAGVLVHRKFLITTAICVFNKRASDIYIKFVSDEKDAVKDIIVHPNFVKTMDTLQDNIALVMIEREFTHGDLPCIKKRNIDNSYCHVFSWGTTKLFENSMKVNNMEVMPKGECFTQHLISGQRHEKYVRQGNGNICVGNRHRFELINNLSGSPLTCHQFKANKPTVLKGLLSWSTMSSDIYTNGMKGFNENSYPHIFTDVTNFADWIESTVNEKILNSIY